MQERQERTFQPPMLRDDRAEPGLIPQILAVKHQSSIFSQMMGVMRRQINKADPSLDRKILSRDS
jgi:hypothetical protein